MALMSLLARIGTADPVELRTRMEDLAAGFDIGRFGRAPARFDRDELAHLNTRLIHEMPFEAVRERLGILEAGPDFWEAVKGNLARLDEARDWWLIINEPLQPLVTEADRAVTDTAADVLQSREATAEDWSAIVNDVKARTGVRGKALFHPLRLALTGRENGPELKHLLPLIGKDRAIRRLKGEVA
jgi:glutamyl-tRNA synthetase